MADARAQMVDAAERLVAEEGLGAMSLRAVQAAAGQRNKSAAQYHFGSREGLIEAVVAARMAPVGERRSELLDALRTDPAGPTVRGLVEALVVPLAEHTLGRPGSRWARFLHQASSDPALAAVVARRLEGRSYRAVVEGLLALLGDVPEAVRLRRIGQVTLLAVGALAAAEAHPGPARLPLDVEVTDLVDVCVGALTAPSTAAAVPSPHP